MTRRRKCLQQYSKQLSSFPNQQKSFSKRKRRRMRRFRRQQNRIKIRTNSMNMITQITTDALDMLHISTESNSKPFEFIQRYELTRQHAFTMPINQRPIIFLRENENNQIVSISTSEINNNIEEEEDYYSSYV